MRKKLFADVFFYIFAEMCGRWWETGLGPPLLLVVGPPDGIMLLRGILPEDITI